MYQVGFGDCFLLSFTYEKEVDERDERHILIDFGSTRWPTQDPPSYEEIAADIAARAKGQLDAIVVTHRHKDHLSGFANDEARKTLTGLNPKLVIRPWTEDPKIDADASRPEPSLRLVEFLNRAQEVAGTLGARLAGATGLHGDFAAFAAQQLKNQEAIDSLDAMAEAADGRYLHAGSDSGLEQLIPGIEVAVLGPPTPEVWPAVTKQRENDPEYWLRLANAFGEGSTAAAVGGARDEPAAVVADPGPTRWLIERMQLDSLLSVVRNLDDALNNTSVILLIKVGDRRLLFPGDAQIENWSFALKSAEAEGLRADLPAVDFYKLGHHGSRNATPRSLVEKWQSRDRKLSFALSTMPGVHGHSEETAVPRSTLVAALEDIGQVERTDSLPAGALYVDLVAPTRGDGAFTTMPAS
jgi:hypothetical protein